MKFHARPKIKICHSGREPRTVCYAQCAESLTMLGMTYQQLTANSLLLIAHNYLAISRFFRNFARRFKGASRKDKNI